MDRVLREQVRAPRRVEQAPLPIRHRKHPSPSPRKPPVCRQKATGHAGRNSRLGSGLFQWSPTIPAPASVPIACGRTPALADGSVTGVRIQGPAAGPRPRWHARYPALRVRQPFEGSAGPVAGDPLAARATGRRRASCSLDVTSPRPRSRCVGDSDSCRPICTRRRISRRPRACPGRPG
jgi:hypothetical protein